jgi:hypothetical protein
MKQAISVPAVFIMVCATLWIIRAETWLRRHLRRTVGARPARQTYLG